MNYIAFNASIHLASFMEQVEGYTDEWKMIAAHNWCFDNQVDFNTIPKYLL